MEDYEKAIEEAADFKYTHQSANPPYCEIKEKATIKGFIEGAKSLEAKAFHTQGMYTEEEILIFLKNCIKFIGKDEQSEIWMRLNYKSWFDQNKKKS